jgi:hypothetical protein
MKNFRFQISNLRLLLSATVALAIVLAIVVPLRADIDLKKTNFGYSTLDGGITNTATSLTLSSGDGSKFPALGWFRAVLWGANYGDPALDPNAEIVNATLSAGDTFTIQRAQESTTAQAWSSGDNLALTITKGVIDEWEGEINAKSDAGHDHNSVYYTEGELDGGVLNSIYYTESEMDGGVLNSIYYTEGEMDNKLAQPCFSVYNGTSDLQAIPSATETVIAFIDVEYDTDGSYLNTTFRYTPQEAGLYAMYLSVMYNSITDQKRVDSIIRKNGTAYRATRSTTSGASLSHAVSLPVIVNANGTTDYFEAATFHNFGATGYIYFNPSFFYTFWQGCKISDN